ncbi:putative Late nodulin [Medicago truncatula]|uniref:Nodule Cysteine-Rich (NCR) secreted peptide n=1 Tax=Medicago truncatula TaxID=3880 RepID=A0A072U6W1_MEDTR|nr:Nodule Cysteine-Rich (NCR) secreted peptide [Medicago truncatula]RHN44129.1 putative Late nodulin [Medicago truncatula]
MVKTLKFVYILILFICIFLVMIVCDSAYLPLSRSCITDKDCSRVKNYNARCRKGYCQYLQY